jgi:hypothetical protein
VLIARTFTLGMITVEGAVTYPTLEVFLNCAPSMQKEECEEGGNSAHNQPLTAILWPVKAELLILRFALVACQPPTIETIRVFGLPTAWGVQNVERTC